MIQIYHLKSIWIHFLKGWDFQVALQGWLHEQRFVFNSESFGEVKKISSSYWAWKRCRLWTHMKVPYQTTASLICRHKRGENDKNGILGKRRWLSLSSHLGNTIKLSSSAVGVPALSGSTCFTPSVFPRDCPGPSRELGHHWGHQAASQGPCERRSPSSPNVELKEPGGCSPTA